MTPQAFLDLSTKLCKDMKEWIAEAGKDQTLSTEHLAALDSAIEIINQVTLKDVSARTEA